MNTLAEKTKYRNIYRGTYWGEFIDREDDDQTHIIKNRNKFAKNFKIKNKYTGATLNKLISRLKTKTTNKYDHIEAYRTEDKKIILIFSNYGDNEYKTTHGRQFKKMYPLYATNATTYIMVFKDMCDLRYTYCSI